MCNTQNEPRCWLLRIKADGCSSEQGKRWVLPYAAGRRY